MTEVKKLGIEETKDVIKLIIALATDVKESFDDDGKITGGDFIHFSESLKALFPAISGIGGVWPEIQDLDDAELVEIKGMILEALPGIGDKWIEFADNAIKGAYHIYKAIVSFPKG